MQTPDTTVEPQITDEIRQERKRIFWSLMWEQRWRLFGGLISLALCDAMDILPPLFIKWAIDAIEGRQGMPTLAWIGAFVVGAAAVQAVARYYWRHFLIGASHLAGYDLRDRLYRHLLQMPTAWFHRHKTGDLMSRATNDVDEVRQMFGIGLLLLLDALLYLGTVPVILIYLSPALSWYVLLPLPFLPFYVMRMGRLIHDRFSEVQQDLSALSDKAQENLAGMRVVKSFGREESEKRRFAEISQRYRQSNLRLAVLQAAFHPSLDLAMGAAVFLVVWLGGLRVVAGEISIGTFIAFQAALVKMVWPMIALGWTFSLFQRGMASLARCAEILVAPPEEAAPRSATADAATPVIHGEIVFEGVGFRHPEAVRPALDDISFRLPAGQTLALIGPVGGGKTTILELLLRLIAPTRGRILLDGRPLGDYDLVSLRTAIGYVPQDAFLFSTTVAENVAFGLKGATDLDRIRRCIALAAFDSDLAGMPGGLDTLLGERGVNLSGGQKQRLALARALARDPAILVLDDPMSAVDTDTEDRILAGLRQFMAARTSIIVSHRVSTVAHADQILVITDGRISERGRHDELLAAGGWYARLAEKQRLRSTAGTDPSIPTPCEAGDAGDPDRSSPGATGLTGWGQRAASGAAAPHAAPGVGADRPPESDHAGLAPAPASRPDPAPTR